MIRTLTKIKKKQLLRLKLQYHIVQLVILLLACFIVHLTYKPDSGHISFHNFLPFLIGGLLIFFSLIFIDYLKVEYEYLEVKKWSEKIVGSRSKRKDDSVVTNFEDMNIMLTYTNYLYKKVLSIHLVHLPPPNSEINLNISPPYTFGFDFDNQTMQV